MRIKFYFSKEIKLLFTIFNQNNQDNLRLVGGAVRNSLMNKKINDYDFATRFNPQETIAILNQNNIKYLTLGEKHGTITAIINNKKFEITTLRLDVETDGRHSIVEFTKSYQEDAKRRDLTFNALYLDDKKNLYDYFKGITDLKKKMVRFIGEPEKRIQEDYLRILRFFRFFSNYGIFLDYKSFEACKKYKEKLTQLSKERIKNEFCQILVSTNFFTAIFLMNYHGFLKYILKTENLNLKNLEIFFYIKNYINFNYDYLFTLLLILAQNKIENIKVLLNLNNKEAKFINDVLNNISIDINEQIIKQLLFKLKNKEIVKVIIVISLIQMLNSDYVEKINYYLKFINKTKIPQLLTTTQDLINHGFNNAKEYNSLIKQAEAIFFENNCEITKTQIFLLLKN